MPQRIIRFGAFEVDLTASELRKHGSRLRLQEQPFKILEALLKQPGEVVAREDLVRLLWPDGTFVDFERGLNAAVTRLRQTLSDSAENPCYVETVARRGYRFMGQIEAARELPAELPVAVLPEHSSAQVAPRWWLGSSLLLLCAIGACYWLLWRPRATSTVDRTLAVLPLTTEPGFAVCPSFSPDGNQIAYEWEQARQEPRIFVKLIGPGEPVRLTTGSEEESCPVWSPNGKFIAFLRTTGESKRGLFLTPARGGAERKVTEFARGISYYPEYRPHPLAWSVDAKHLIAVIPDANGFSSLFAISTDTGERASLGTSPEGAGYWDRDPAVSPDGKSLVFTRERGYGSADLELIGLTPALRASGELRPLTTESSSGRYAQTAAWTADGSEVIYSSNRNGRPRLWRTGVQPGATPRQVNGVGPESSMPAMSRSGQLVYAHSFRDTNIWRQELSPRSGKRTTQSLIASTAPDSSAQYSPDGTRIAFQSGRSGNYEVWTCGSDGGRCSQLTSYNGPMTGTPRWSPDGKKIAFDSAASAHYQVYVVGADGGLPRRLTFDVADAVIPSWSRDGKWIYFSSRQTGRQEIWKIPALGGHAVRVTRNGGFTAFESVDGRYLYYTKEERKSPLYRSDLEGGGETATAEDVVVRGLAPSESQVFFLRQEKDPGFSTLRTMALNFGPSTSIAIFTKPLDFGLSISPDLKYALYTQIDSEGSSLMIVDQFR